MNDIAQFYISTDEDLRFRLTFANRGFAGRTLAIMIRERATNELKTTLTAPSRITISSTGPIPGVTPDPPASNDIVAALPKSLMAGWATGDYEADLLDVTVGSATRICPVRFTYDQPGRLVHGVEGNQATIYVNDENQAIVTAVGGVGVPGPANTLAAGTIEMLPSGDDPEITITGDAPNQTLNLKIPRGLTGLTGAAGQIISSKPTRLPPGRLPPSRTKAARRRLNSSSGSREAFRATSAIPATRVGRPSSLWRLTPRGASCRWLIGSAAKAQSRPPGPM